MYHSIIDKHKNLDLNESTHTYTLCDSNIKFTSVTEFISSFFNPFDEYKIAKKLSTLKKYNHMSTEEILQDWERRRDRGTVVHKQIEEFLHERDRKLQSLEKNADTNCSLDLKTKQGIEFLKEKCINENNNLFPEIKIYSKELQIAGTIKASNKFVFPAPLHLVYSRSLPRNFSCDLLFFQTLLCFNLSKF